MNELDVEKSNSEDDIDDESADTLSPLSAFRPSQILKLGKQLKGGEQPLSFSHLLGGNAPSPPPRSSGHLKRKAPVEAERTESSLSIKKFRGFLSDPQDYSSQFG